MERGNGRVRAPPPHTTAPHHATAPHSTTSEASAASETCACARAPQLLDDVDHYIYDGETYEGWGYFFEQGYETSQALQARLATFLRGTAGWTVAVEQW